VGRALSLATLGGRIPRCDACPRLVEFLKAARRKLPDGWCRPVPGFGDPNARLLILGLAPGLRGANRTGRPFTGDAAGVWLYRALHEAGVATAPEAHDRNDGLELRDAWLTNVVKCVPPGNRPVRDEFRRCAELWLEDELRALPRVRVILALGGDAHRQSLDLLRERPRTRFPFAHGAVHTDLGEAGLALVDTYHPSRQNTNTGRLTWNDFLAAVREAVKLAHSA
jgi:uracil-DNA glycosylase family 4